MMAKNMLSWEPSHTAPKDGTKLIFVQRQTGWCHVLYFDRFWRDKEGSAVIVGDLDQSWVWTYFPVITDQT